MERDYSRQEVLDIIESEARERNIPRDDFMRFAYIETGGTFNEQASRGAAGAKGLFQFVPYRRHGFPRSTRMQFKKAIVVACTVAIAACQANTTPHTAVDAPALSERTSAVTTDPPVGHAGELSSQKDEIMTEQLRAFADGNTNVLDIQQGDLEGNGGQGAVLVLDHPGTGNEKLGEGKPRSLLLITRDGAGRLQQVGRNDLLIPCAQCGGLAGDPFGYIQVNDGRFTVLTEGGSRERWSNEYAFKYSAGQQGWVLEKAVRTVVDTETGEEKRIELTSEQFGSIRFDEFDPEVLPRAEKR